jgi:hypothetical protein
MASFPISSLSHFDPAHFPNTLSFPCPLLLIQLQRVPLLHSGTISIDIIISGLDSVYE